MTHKHVVNFKAHKYSFIETQLSTCITVLPVGPQNQKYLLSGPSQKTFAGPILGVHYIVKTKIH